MLCFLSINKLICDLLTVIYTQLACRGTDRLRMIPVCQCANASKYLSGKEERNRERICVYYWGRACEWGRRAKRCSVFLTCCFPPQRDSKLWASWCNRTLSGLVFIHLYSFCSFETPLCSPHTSHSSPISLFDICISSSVLCAAPRSVLQTAGWDGTGLSLLISSLFILLLITCCSPLISFTFSLSHALLQGLGACDVFTPRIIIVIFFLCVCSVSEFDPSGAIILFNKW